MAPGLLIQIDGYRERPTMRVRPWPLQRGQRTSGRTIHTAASGSRRFTLRSRSMTVLQASHAMMSQ